MNRVYFSHALHLVTDHKHGSLQDLEKLVYQAVLGGVTAVQLRNKTAHKRSLFKVGQALLTLLRPKNIPLIINDHADLALALGADGVHIGQLDLPFPEVRTMLHPHQCVGLSISTTEQAMACQHYDVDYFGVGPIFSTKTKEDAGATLRTAGLKTLCQLLDAPCVAIGGIGPEHITSIQQCGVAGVAVSSGICLAEDPQAAARCYKTGTRYEKK